MNTDQSDLFIKGYVQGTYEAILMILETHAPEVQDKCVEEIISWHQFAKSNRKKPK